MPVLILHFKKLALVAPSGIIECTSLKTIWKFLDIFKVLLRGQMRQEIMFGGKKAPKPHDDCEASWRVEPP